MTVCGKVGDFRQFRWYRRSSSFCPNTGRGLLISCPLSNCKIGARRPYAVDVLSGVEKSRGIRDPEKISALMASAMAL